MGTQYQVKQGESVESIAFTSGLLSKTVWDDPANADLKEARKSLHVLLPGDSLYVPDITVNTVKCATGKEHVFKRKQVPSKLKVRFLIDGQPLASKSYTFTVDGQAAKAKTGTTDGDGWLKEDVSPIAKVAVVELDQKATPDPDYDPAPFEEEGDDIVRDGDPPPPPPAPPTKRVYTINLRWLDPSSEVTGAQGRLSNLGYWPGAIDGVLGPRTTEALQSFQNDNKLDPSGELDDATQSKLAQFAGG